MKYLIIFSSIIILSACSLTNNNRNISDTNSSTLNIPTTNTPTPTTNNNNFNNPIMTNLKLKTPEELLKISPNQKIIALIETSLGSIELELFPEQAPITVANFVGLSEGTQPWIDPQSNTLIENKPLYQEVIFHRVIKDFMIQGGDPLGMGIGGPGYKFEDETNNDLKFNKPGILAMANSGKNTNGSQFFITTKETPWLDGNHTIFGQVINGFDVLTKIENVQTNSQDKPITEVIIKNIKIIRQQND